MYPGPVDRGCGGQDEPPCSMHRFLCCAACNACHVPSTPAGSPAAALRRTVLVTLCQAVVILGLLDRTHDTSAMSASYVHVQQHLHGVHTLTHVHRLVVPVTRSCQSPIWTWLVNNLHLHLHRQQGIMQCAQCNARMHSFMTAFRVRAVGV